MANFQSVTQHRTQVYFPKDLFKEIKRVSQKEDVSVAEIIRRAVIKEIKAEKKLKEKAEERERAWQKFFKAAGIIKNGLRDLSVNHDKYLAEGLLAEYRQSQKKYRE